MLVIPAIDLKGGKVVRLEQGKMDRDKAYSDDPASMARHWASLGAELIHVVDLDGAFAGRPVNDGAVVEIARASGVPIELGGGVRSLDTIQYYIERGVERVILGTVAHKNPDLVRQACQLFPNRIVVGIDAREGMVSIQGWAEDTDGGIGRIPQLNLGLSHLGEVEGDDVCILHSGGRTGGEGIGGISLSQDGEVGFNDIDISSDPTGKGFRRIIIGDLEADVHGLDPSVNCGND